MNDQAPNVLEFPGSPVGIEETPDSDQHLAVHLIICLRETDIRAGWAALLAGHDFEHERASCTNLRQLWVEYLPTLEQAPERIDQILRNGNGSAVVLLADGLLERRGHGRICTPIARTLRERFARELYASVAISPLPGRVADIDLVLTPQPPPAVVTDGLSLLVERLRYFARPPSRPALPGLEVRRLSTRHELYQSFKLRYRVYSVMGYLEQEFLDTESRVELGWCDAISVHFGAFIPTQGNGRELVGTSRLILTRHENNSVSEWTYAIASARPMLSDYFKKQRRGLAQFRLPIFRNFALNDEMCEAALADVPWGELSRVVVPPKYRGRGVSRHLIKAALNEAESMHLNRVFLECLEIHRAMYEAHGFSSIGQRAEVMGIGKTMIGMVRCGTAPGNAPLARE